MYKKLIYHSFLPYILILGLATGWWSGNKSVKPEARSVTTPSDGDDPPGGAGGRGAEAGAGGKGEEKEAGAGGKGEEAGAGGKGGAGAAEAGGKGEEEEEGGKGEEEEGGKGEEEEGKGEEEEAGAGAGAGGKGEEEAGGAGTDEVQSHPTGIPTGETSSDEDHPPVAEGNPTLAVGDSNAEALKSAVLAQAKEFRTNWNQVCLPNGIRPFSVKKFFRNQVPRLHKRGQELWKIIKGSLQEEGAYLSAATGALGQAVTQIDRLVGAATALAILDPKKLSEEDLQVHFVEQLGGSGVDLTTIPEEVQGDISVVKEILQKHIEAGNAPSGDMSEEAKKALQANTAQVEKMREYLDLLEGFIDGISLAPAASANEQSGTP